MLSAINNGMKHLHAALMVIRSMNNDIHRQMDPRLSSLYEGMDLPSIC